MNGKEKKGMNLDQSQDDREGKEKKKKEKWNQQNHEEAKSGRRDA